MLKRLITYMLGHLRIEVRSDQVERFLNAALAQAIDLWGIERTAESMRVSIRVQDFFALRPAARQARARVRILGRHGLPFAVRRLRRRPVLIAGALICLAFLFWASGHIWIIKVTITAPQNLDRRAVAAVAADAGLRRGVWASRVDLGRVEERIQQRMGEVSRAIVRVQGTRAVIEIVEKDVQPRLLTGQTGCVNLIARKGGVIEQVVPFQGEPVVAKGSIVKPGDLLVECAFKYWEGGRPSVYPGTPLPPRTDVARTLVAQAIIRARISYREYTEVPLVQEVAIPTGKVATRWVLKWKDRSILEIGGKAPPFDRFEEERATYSFGSWRNWKSPVELVTLNAKEMEWRQERISLEQAVQQATLQLAGRLRWLLLPSDELLAPPKAEVLVQTPDFVGIAISVETLEEIARPWAAAPIPEPAPASPEANPAQPSR